MWATYETFQANLDRILSHVTVWDLDPLDEYRRRRYTRMHFARERKYVAAQIYSTVRLDL
jgi:hypothetical protein